MNRLFHGNVMGQALLAALLGAMLATQSAAQAQTCPFDDGNSTIEIEGLILARYALGLTGAPLVANTNINAVDAPTVEATINCPSCGLNITGNPTMTVADATIISRKLAGFSGAALTNNLALGSGTRNTPAAVQSFLLSGCGATGGTLTSITAGIGLTGGTITTSGMIAVDTTFLQRRVATPCVAGSFITSIAADGTSTCATPPSGAGGTGSSVGTGQGLTGGPISATGTIDLAANQLLPITACAANQIAKWSGSAWACATDIDTNNSANDARYFKQGGNAFGATAVIGTSDNQTLQLVAGNTNVMRFEPVAESPNIIGGYVNNGVFSGVHGATIAGGGTGGTVVGAGGDACPNGFGCQNSITDHYGTIGGGVGNLVGDTVGTVSTAPYGTVAGGLSNAAAGVATTVSGGMYNKAAGVASSVGGGSHNIAFSSYDNVSGGENNVASGGFSSVLGGDRNVASGTSSSVLGGSLNVASSPYSSVAGGDSNLASGGWSSVMGGTHNVASERWSSVMGGYFNVASAAMSSVAGGRNNTASGDNSFAAGSYATADRNGAFVWADVSTPTSFATSTVWAAPFGANTFSVRAVGGVMFATSVNGAGVPATYCFMGNSGTGWLCASDQNIKERIEPITPSQVLAGVLAMPVSTWSIIGSKVRQMGPMAQDFYRAFGLGDTDKAINSIDVGGVAFAAIQGLNQKLTDEVKALRAELAASKREAKALASLKSELAMVKRKLGM